MGTSNINFVKNGKKSFKKTGKAGSNVHGSVKLKKKHNNIPGKDFVKNGKKSFKRTRKAGSNVHASVKQKKQHNDIPENDGDFENEQSIDARNEAEDSSADEIEDYEKTPRMQINVNVRNLLPVKHRDGLIFRTEVVENEIEEEDEDPAAKEPELNKKRPLTLVERYAIQKKVLNDLKCKVALLCTSIVQDPENNIAGMKDLMTMLYDTKSQMVVSEKKILCVSLLHVFSDILPSYKIRVQEEMDPKLKLKKDTRRLLSFEHNMLRHYKRYIDYLCKLVQEMKMKKKQTFRLSENRIKALYEVGLIAVKCLAELLSTRFSFNYFKNIANVIVPLIIEGNDKVSNICCQSFERMFRADKLGAASYDLVQQIVNFIKDKNFCVPACLLKSFLSLNLREAKPEEHKVDMKKGRKEWCDMSRTERRNKKKMKELEAELKEAQAHESVETVQKFHVKTLNKVFWVFFHVLKDGKKLSLLGPALEGLSKFAYLINLEFFNDLNSVLCGLMESGKLSDVDKLHSVYTLFTILAGQAESLHIDPHKIYCHMYQGLLILSHYTDVEHFILSLKCLEFNILRKRKKISFGRILAFTKRVATVSLQTPIHGTLALLCAIRNVFLNVRGTDILLDTESTVGSGVYFPEMEDPEHCNANSATLWELNLLRKHYNPFIKLYSQYLLNGCPTQGKLALPGPLLKSSPEDTLNLFADVAVHNKMEFLEDSDQPPQKKFRYLESDDFVYEKDLDFDLTWKQLKNVDCWNC